MASKTTACYQLGYRGITWWVKLDSNQRVFWNQIYSLAASASRPSTLDLRPRKPVTATIYLLAVRTYGYPSALAFFDRFRIHALRIPPKGSGAYIHPDLIPSTVCQRCRKSFLLQFCLSLPVLILCLSLGTTVDATH